MAQRKQLTEREVSRLRAPGRHSIGGNLLLQIGPTGSRSWLARITDAHRRRREIGLGACRDVTLGAAREKVRLARQTVAAGGDPVAALNPTPMPSFENLAREMHEERSPTYRNAKHRAQWITSLERYAFPSIGAIPVDAISSADVMRVVAPIWLTHEETARRVLQRIAAVAAYAVPKGFREHELPVNGIRNALPKQRRKVRHHPACRVEDAPRYYSAVASGPNGMSAYAVRLLMLTAARSGEIRGAKWDEFDLEQGVWTVPAERMKAGREHRVPLSQAALSLLETIPRVRNKEEFVFPNAKGKPLSDTALSKVFKAAAPGFTIHGWRSTFKDWATTETDFHDDVSEAALAHVDGNRVRAAYKRTDLFEKRQSLMEMWSDYLADPNSEVALR